ncbi:hypothetical protein D3C87_1815000 [compost metagenome]
MQHAFIPAFAQAGVFVAEIVVDQRDALTSAVRQLADHVLRGVYIVNSDAGNGARISVFCALHPRGASDQGREFRQFRERVHSDDPIDDFSRQQAQAGA